MKECNKCGKIKELTDFGNQPRNKGGKKHQCKSCESDYAKERYLENRDQYLKQQKEYQYNNKEKVRESKKRYRDKNKEKLSEYNSNYAKNNRDKINEYYRNKRKNDIQFYISDKVRARIKLSMFHKSNSARELLGCDFDFYLKYLENLFVDGMSWENRSEWHIDHIKPIASFDLTDDEQIFEAFHYTNTQPLWAKDNLSKGSRLIHIV